MTEFEFRKSSYSGGEQQHECLEVAVNVAGVVAVRDSKEPGRAWIRCAPGEWEAFLSYAACEPVGSAPVC